VTLSSEAQLVGSLGGKSTPRTTILNSGGDYGTFHRDASGENHNWKAGPLRTSRWTAGVSGHRPASGPGRCAKRFSRFTAVDAQRNARVFLEEASGSVDESSPDTTKHRDYTNR